MALSRIDQLVDYTYEVRSLILKDRDIMALLSNDPDIDLDGDDIEQYEDRVKDHDYVDETVLTSNAYICIEAEMASLDTTTVKTMYVYVNIICQKNYMELSPKLFKGVKGNRRDNLARRIDLLLNNNFDFGIGQLKLVGATIGSVPTGFTSRILTYKVPDFA